MAIISALLYVSSIYILTTDQAAYLRNSALVALILILSGLFLVSYFTQKKDTAKLLRILDHILLALGLIIFVLASITGLLPFLSEAVMTAALVVAVVFIGRMIYALRKDEKSSAVK